MSNHALLVYVQLGNNRDELLLDNANFAKLSLHKTRMLLITDKPNYYQAFPGEIIAYARSCRIEETMTKLKAIRNELVGYAMDYWFLTFERILALEQVMEIVNEEESIIHLESDVLPLMTSRELEMFIKNRRGWQFGRFSSNLASAGFIFIENIHELQIGLGKLHEIARAKKEYLTWSIDMEIMANFLDLGLGIELVTQPEPNPKFVSQTELPIAHSRDLRKLNKRYLFDSGDLGVYLFGRNSVNSSGVIRSGFTYEHIDWPIESSFWLFLLTEENASQALALFVFIQGSIYRVPFLHVVSKLNLVGNNCDLLRQLVPINAWFDRASFPSEGIPIASRHRAIDQFKVVNKLRFRRLIRMMQNLMHPKRIRKK
jgi:hypothetical protein